MDSVLLKIGFLIFEVIRDFISENPNILVYATCIKKRLAPIKRFGAGFAFPAAKVICHR